MGTAPRAPGGSNFREEVIYNLMYGIHQGYIVSSDKCIIIHSSRPYESKYFGVKMTASNNAVIYATQSGKYLVGPGTNSYSQNAFDGIEPKEYSAGETLGIADPNKNYNTIIVKAL